jgi:uncharacterized membrane protein
MDAPAMDTSKDIPATRRWQAVDIARGLAILAMIAYHLAWDLSLFRLIPVEVAEEPLGRLAARLIAGSFLFLVGVGLVLAHGRSFHARAFWRRLGIIAAAALLVTVATYWTFPGSYIFFGVLHAVALFSLVALPFGRLPAPVTLTAAALCLALPHLPGVALDEPVLAFLGLGRQPPVTNDFIPVFPWLGLTLLGVAAMRLCPPRIRAALAGWSSDRAPARLLAAAGRHSLLVYLVHQPVLIGTVYLLAAVAGPHPEAGRGSFLSHCEESCRTTSGGAAGCREACACSVDALRREGLLTATLSNRLGQEERARSRAVTEACFRKPR